MAKSNKSVKNSSKMIPNVEVSPTKKKVKASSIKHSKSDITVEMAHMKPQLSIEETKDTDSTLQLSIDTNELGGDRGTSIKLYFPHQFSMLQNMEFLDHISDAENIIFDNSVYAICKDVATAEQIRVSAKGISFQHGSNSILRAERLGPAFCSFKRKGEDPTVLTIKKLPLGLSYQDLQIRFPAALDICLKKTMAKITFADSDTCKLSWLSAADLAWPGGVIPSVGEFVRDINALESDEEVDPDHLKFGHPRKFVEDPCVLFLLLKNRFELTKGMEVLDVLKTATDILLSRSCTVVFSNSEVALKRRQLLAGHSVAGGDVVAWIPRRSKMDAGGDKYSHRPNQTLTKPEVMSSEDEETTMQPLAKKMKKITK